MKKNLILLIIFLSLALSVRAEVVILKNGKKIEGKILARTTQFIQIDIGLGVDLTYYLDQVDYIDGIKIKTTDGTFVAIDPEEEINENAESLAVDIADGSDKFINNIDIQRLPEKLEKDTFGIISDNNGGEGAEQFIENDKMEEYQRFERFKVFIRLFELFKNSLETSAFPFVIIGITVSIFLFFWILSCLPLVFIAKRLGISHRWMALFPVLQLFLFIRLAGVSLWWVILLFIPFVNFFIPLVLWFKIAEALEQQTWLAFLMYVPLVNYFVLWYFALSKRQIKEEYPL